MFYKMFKHEPMNNPALGESRIASQCSCKKVQYYFIILQKHDGNLLPYSIRRG